LASTDVQNGGVSGVVSETSPLLRLRGVTKWFPGVQGVNGARNCGGLYLGRTFVVAPVGPKSGPISHGGRTQLLL